MARYDQHLGEMTYDHLISSSKFPILTGMRKLRKGQGKLKRGTALSLSEGDAGDGTLVLLGESPQTDETLRPNAVLCDEIDTDVSEYAEVYLTGCFTSNALVLKENQKLTTADIEEFRKSGIILQEMME